MSDELLLLRLDKRERFAFFLKCFVIPIVRFLLLFSVATPLAAFSRNPLELFFRDLVENTTAGYALYGEKPVDLQGFRELEQTLPDTKERQRSVIGLLACKVLQNCPRKTDHYILTITPISTGYEILTINKKAFLKIVETNALLFKAKFGIDYTPQFLLNQLVSLGFSHVLKESIALQGILLGYGTENALAYERCSSFLRSLQAKEKPPERLPSLCKNPDDQIAQVDDPAMLKQMREITYYKPGNQKDKTKIPFSYLKNSNTSLKLISEYKKTQLQTEKALKRPQFLSDVCNRFGISFITNDPWPNTLFPLNVKEASSLVGKLLRQTFPRQISEEFISGMRDAAGSDFLDIPRVIQQSEFGQRGSSDFLAGARDIAKGKDRSEDEKSEAKPTPYQNRFLSHEWYNSDLRFLDVLWQRDPALTQKSNDFLANIAQNPSVKCKIPGYLYISTLKECPLEGELTQNHETLKAHFLIKNPDDSPICGSYQLEEPPILRLNELMPGIAHGLMGARKGEIRKIYIHPDIAYGPSSSFAQGSALIVTVEVKEIGHLDTTTHLPPIQLIDVQNFAPKIDSANQFTSLLKKHAYACGFRSWRYYKQAEPLISLQMVIDFLLKEESKPLSAQEKLTVLQLEWILQEKIFNPGY